MYVVHCSLIICHILLNCTKYQNRRQNFQVLATIYRHGADEFSHEFYYLYIALVWLVLYNCCMSHYFWTRVTFCTAFILTMHVCIYNFKCLSLRCSVHLTVPWQTFVQCLWQSKVFRWLYYNWSPFSHIACSHFMIISYSVVWYCIVVVFSWTDALLTGLAGEPPLCWTESRQE